MALSCSYIPYNTKGEELTGFQTYRVELGYKVAAKVFTQVLSPSFQEKYKRTLELDAQGVPTYESALKVPYIKNLVGNAKLINTDQKKFPYVENVGDNYRRLVLSAHAYNTSSGNRDNLVAVVTPSEDGKQIRIEIRERTDNNVNEYKNQYSTSLLNDRLIAILGDLGVTIDLLEQNELTDGFVDFSKAASIADGFVGLINIADGMKGELALSEEFSHVLIGMLRDTPLVQRSLALLASNDALMQEILGEEYQKNVDYYSANPNYDSFGNEIALNETLAEEALGRVLQDKLKTETTTDTTEEASKPLNNLVQRIINYIKKLFKGKNSDDIIKAKNDVDASMGELAKEVLTGTRKLSTEELIKNQRNAKFQHLSEATDKVLKLLSNADEIERKRSKIAPKDMTDDIKARIIKLEAMMTDAKKMEGLFTYAKWALSDLQNAMDKLDISGTLESSDFTVLRHIKSVLDSYSGFIKDFHDVLDTMGDDVIISVGREDINLRELWREINDLYETCTSQFKKQAFATFSDYLAPVYEKSPLRNEDGSVKELKDVLVAEEFDISEFDRWLTSMGESSSILLQLFDKVVKNAKDKVRIKTIHNIRDIWKLRDNIEKRGITSFEWAFEKDSEGHKTGYYISAYNRGQFEKDEEKMLKDLKEKYGEHPLGENFKKYMVERKAWYETHSKRDMSGAYVPGSI